MSVSTRWRKRLAVLIAMAVAMPAAVAVGWPAEAPASTVHTHGKVSFVAHPESSYSGSVDRACPEPPPGVTQVALMGGSELGADPADTYVGSYAWEACFYLQEDGSATARGESRFDGTFTGCGSGTLSFTFWATLSAPDPETGVRQSHDVGRVVPGSGTGDLAGVTKAMFDSRGEVAPDLSINGTMTGYLLC